MTGDCTSNRSGGRGWFTAVMLLVLLAAAGLPGGNAELSARQRIETNSEAPPARLLRVAAGELPAAEQVGGAPVEQLPRPLPRTRSVQARGLPPSRAPTA